MAEEKKVWTQLTTQNLDAHSFVNLEKDFDHVGTQHPPQMECELSGAMAIQTLDCQGDCLNSLQDEGLLW